MGCQLSRGAIAPPGYVLESFIDSGTFGKVFKARRLSDGTECAIKQIDLSGMSAAACAQLSEEGNILSRLDHVGVVRCFGSVPDEAGLVHNIIMEFCSKGNLQNHVSSLSGKRLHPDDFPALALRLLQALDYLHSQQVMHRDIKVRCGNISM